MIPQTHHGLCVAGGKRDAGANHLRFGHRRLTAVAEALPRQGGFAFVAGPAGMTIELFDEEVSR